MFGYRAMRWLIFFGVCCKFGCFDRNALEDIVDEGVEDGHCFVGDTGVGVDMLQHLNTTLHPPLAILVLPISRRLGGLLRRLLPFCRLCRGLEAAAGRGALDTVDAGLRVGGIRMNDPRGNWALRFAP